MSWDFENRLELARRMRYACGGHADVPDRPGLWFTKPIRNPAGMGVGARLDVYVGGPSPCWAYGVQPGCMWMPVFRGEHLSADFQRGRRGAWRQQLTVRCEYDAVRARPARWRVEDVPLPVPDVLRDVDSEWLNVEFIGGSVIEAHGRRNTDFDRAPPGARVAHVVWADQLTPPQLVPDFDDAEGQLAVARLGFVYR
jgi:hypothetical protein